MSYWLHTSVSNDDEVSYFLPRFINDPPKMKELLDEGANPNYTFVKHDFRQNRLVTVEVTSILNFAIENEEIETVKLLLDYWASPQSLKGTDYPLEQAIFENNYDIVAMLIQYGADVNAFSEQGSMLTIAVSNRRVSLEIVDLLIRKGANVNQTDLSGKSVLMYASDTTGISFEKVELLINNGADPKHRDGLGRDIFYYLQEGEENIRMMIEDVGEGEEYLVDNAMVRNYLTSNSI